MPCAYGRKSGRGGKRCKFLGGSWLGKEGWRRGLGLTGVVGGV